MNELLRDRGERNPMSDFWWFPKKSRKLHCFYHVTDTGFHAYCDFRLSAFYPKHRRVSKRRLAQAPKCQICYGTVPSIVREPDVFPGHSD